MSNSFPKLHNAMWPGLVGKGGEDAEPHIEFDKMLELTADAEVNGQKFDGIDFFLFDPHINIDISEDDLKAIDKKVKEIVNASAEFAKDSPEPAVEELWTDIYA